MIDGIWLIADIAEHTVFFDIRSRVVFGDIFGDGRFLHNSARTLSARHHILYIFWVWEIVWINQYRSWWVSRIKPNGAAAFRAQIAAMTRDGKAASKITTMLNHARYDKMQLSIWPFFWVVTDTKKRARFSIVGRQQARAILSPLANAFG